MLTGYIFILFQLSFDINANIQLFGVVVVVSVAFIGMVNLLMSKKRLQTNNSGLQHIINKQKEKINRLEEECSNLEAGQLVLQKEKYSAEKQSEAAYKLLLTLAADIELSGALDKLNVFDPLNIISLQTFLKTRKLESNEYDIVETELNINQIMDRFIQMFSPLELMALESEDEALRVVGDEVLLNLLLGNLISNAIQYGKSKDGIKIRVKKEGDTNVEIHVVDKGPGIPKKHRNAIFQKHHSLNTGYAKGSSAGIGLYFCKLAASQLSGDISIVSTSGAGADFILTLPLNN
jgi:signal transduction histidine kinase